jgi:hypothetical protein
MEVSGQFQAPAALPPGKVARYPLNRRLGRPHSRSQRPWKKKETSCYCKDSNSGPSSPQPVAIPTVPSLPRADLYSCINLGKTFDSSRVRQQTAADIPDSRQATWQYSTVYINIQCALSKAPHRQPLSTHQVRTNCAVIRGCQGCNAVQPGRYQLSYHAYLPWHDVIQVTECGKPTRSFNLCKKFNT